MKKILVLLMCFLIIAPCFAFGKKSSEKRRVLTSQDSEIIEKKTKREEKEELKLKKEELKQQKKDEKKEAKQKAKELKKQQKLEKNSQQKNNGSDVVLKNETDYDFKTKRNYIDPSKVDVAYVQKLIDEIATLEKDDPSLSREKIQKLQAEVDEMLKVLRSYR